MLALEVVVAIAVLVGVALLATGRFDTLDDEPPDGADLGLPTGRLLRSDDIPRLRLRAVGGIRGGLRGYRMADVDAVMTHVYDALRAAEEGPAAAGGERRVTASAQEPPIRPAPSPGHERPAEPEPLPPPPPSPMEPEPTPRPEPPIADQPSGAAESRPVSSLEETRSSRPAEGD